MKRAIAFIAALTAITVTTPVRAATERRSADEARITQCVRQAARGRDWLEKTLRGLRAQEAGWLGAEVANTNGTHDLGPLQINSSWVPKISRMVERTPEQVRHWLRYDPCFNAEAARWIFLSGLEATGDYWKAVGIYHSPTVWRQRAYAAKVAVHMRRLYGDGIFTATARNRTAAR